ncbi:MAG: DUF3108 domain-containing protein [Marinibacterium sp.]
MRAIATAAILTALALAPGPSAAAEIRTRAEFRMKILGTPVADMRMDGTTTATRYSVTGTLTTTGLVSALIDVRYSGTASGRRTGTSFRPGSYTETVTEGRETRSGALMFRGGVPHPRGFKAEERGADALPIRDQHDTVDPLTAIFMVLRDQSADEVCRLDQHVFDGERRTRITFTKARDVPGGLTCTGTYRRIAGYPHDRTSKRRKVVPMVVQYRLADGLYRATEVRMISDFGAAVLRRK